MIEKIPTIFLKILVRLIGLALAYSLYRVKVVGEENLPKEGGALLVCNHVSFVDPPLVFASIKRPVRFLVFREIYNIFFVKPFCKITKAIPISFSDRPKAILYSLQQARQAVCEGHLVCIFAEGGLTRTGNMLPFHKGFEHIMKDLNRPIIPMNIDRIWGSIFSYENGRYFWKVPKVLPYPITISFGKPMPAHAQAYEVRAAVQELSADAFKLRGAHQKKLHIAFIDEAKKHPFKFCMADSMGLKLNYIQVLAGVLAMSKKLFSVDRKKNIENEMVGVLLPACCAAAMVNGAILCAGKIPVNLNFTASRESIEYAIKECRMATIISARRFLEKIHLDMNDHVLFLEDINKGINTIDKIKALLVGFLLPSFLLKRFCVKGDKVNIEDVTTVIFSSGSTGIPKGVMLSHRNIFSNIEGLYQVLKVQPKDVIIGVLPFFHSFGFTGTLCFPMGAGIGAVYHSNPLDASTVGKLVNKYKATIIMGTPTFLSAYTRKCTKEQFRSLRYAVAGAEKLKKPIADAFYEKFSIVPFEGYGATELSPVVAMGIPDYISSKEHIKQVGYKEGKVGHPIPGVAIKVIDPDTQQMLAHNQEGLLLVKGPNVMKGYLNQPEKTAEVVKDGWYITGDIAAIDEDGFLCITDRISRFSKIGGEMVPHVKVEEVILEAMEASEPACVVTAVSDEKKGERLVVLHKGDLKVDEIWSKLNAKDIPKLWIPKKECFYKVDDIPLLGSGKLDLKKIKAIAQDRSTETEVRK